MGHTLMPGERCDGFGHYANALIKPGVTSASGIIAHIIRYQHSRTHALHSRLHCCQYLAQLQLVIRFVHLFDIPSVIVTSIHITNHTIPPFSADVEPCIGYI